MANSVLLLQLLPVLRVILGQTWRGLERLTVRRTIRADVGGARALNRGWWWWCRPTASDAGAQAMGGTVKRPRLRHLSASSHGVVAGSGHHQSSLSG